MVRYIQKKEHRVSDGRSEAEVKEVYREREIEIEIERERGREKKTENREGVRER